MTFAEKSRQRAFNQLDEINEDYLQRDEELTLRDKSAYNNTTPLYENVALDEEQNLKRTNQSFNSTKLKRDDTH